MWGSFINFFNVLSFYVIFLVFFIVCKRGFYKDKEIE